MQEINNSGAFEKNSSFLEKLREVKGINITEALEKNRAFLEKVRETSGQNPGQCCQCMKCTGGCPFQFIMDYPPSHIMRMLQNGLIDEVLNSFTIWACATCSTCSARCPRGIDVAKIMDTLRVIAYRRGITGKGKNMAVFHRAFMNSVGSHGRVFEFGLAMGINLGTGNLAQDTELGLPMLIKRKISFFPHKIKGKAEIRKLFEYAAKRGE